MSPITEFVAPESVDEAAQILRDKGEAACVLAGGTDVMVRVRRGLVPPSVSTLVSVHRIGALRGARVKDDQIVVGAATTASDLLRDPLVARRAPILVTVAGRLASAQIRNMATVGGNLANASPAGDLINPLLLLDAGVVLVSAEGRREVPVAELFTGPGESVLRPDELLVEVRFAPPPPERVFGFEKAGTRPAMECSVVTVGLAYTPRDGLMHDVRVAFGSSAPVPLRGFRTEAVLEGRQLGPSLIERASEVASSEVAPISDVRGSESYRRVLAGAFLRRLLDA